MGTVFPCFPLLYTGPDPKIFNHRDPDPKIFNHRDPDPALQKFVIRHPIPNAKYLKRFKNIA